MAQARFDESLALISAAIARDGWSHALLRRLVAVRQNLPDTNDEAEALLHRAGLQANLVSVTSLVHAFSPEHSLLTIKRSILNIVDRGPVNKFSRTIARIPVQPFAANEQELTSLLVEARKCSLVDAVVLAWFNSHLTSPYLPRNISKLMGEFSNAAHFERLLQIYPTSDPESEYLFYKQSSAWLEYEPIRRYRVLVDNYYDASSNSCLQLVGEHADIVRSWVGEPSLRRLVAGQQFTLHGLPALAALEIAGTVSRSAVFNYWLQSTEGQVGFDLSDLLKLMGLTRELSRTVPVDATRTAARLSVDPLARLILLLLLAKRSNNELDSFHLRKLLEDTAIKKHGGSLVRLLEAFHIEHPYVSEYIYEIATEDFLAKLNRIAPHLSDIPEIRASLHEWMARVSGDKHFEDRARAVRIDHQLNRIRNEIDDHRIYVDPSRFSSWIQDEMMLELNSALAATGTGRRQVPVMGDEVVLSQVMRQCYSAFCSNAMFGIASYIGRRIRHGTFHGHLYSGVIHHVEKSEPFQVLSKDPQFASNWETWKARLDSRVSEIIKEKLHVNSKAKPQGLLQPDYYTPHKQEIIDAAVGTIISTYSELKSTEGIELVITDYCWRLAEVDLLGITTYLKSQRIALLSIGLIDEMVSMTPPHLGRQAGEFRRDVIHAIDNKLSAISGWFKRPSNVAPKASLALLYDAVVKEVQDSHPDFNPRTEASPHGDIELVGGAYQIMYDSLAVAVSNAARHGDPRRPVRREFSVVQDRGGRRGKRLIVEISSGIRPDQRPEDVSQIIEKRKAANFDDANLYQGSSGIPKLMQLANIRQDFEVESLGVVGDEVRVRFSYALEH